MIRWSRLITVLLALVVVAALTSALYSIISLREASERASSAWHDLEAVYQSRVAMMPDLISALETAGRAGEMSGERLRTAQERVEASALTAGEWKDAARLAEYEAAELALGDVLDRLMASSTLYAELSKANDGVWAQLLLSITYRVRLARSHYNDAVSSYNAVLHSLPETLYAEMLGYRTRAALRS